jgi:hypothetical protein
MKQMILAAMLTFLMAPGFARAADTADLNLTGDEAVQADMQSEANDYAFPPGGGGDHGGNHGGDHGGNGGDHGDHGDHGGWPGHGGGGGWPGHSHQPSYTCYAFNGRGQSFWATDWSRGQAQRMALYSCQARTRYGHCFLRGCEVRY